MPAPPPPRLFGYWAGHFVVMGSMIGAGILTTSGYTLRDTGNPLALLALWAVGGLMAVAGAVTIAELATALPHAGGDYVFVREGFGRHAGFVAGWATFVLGFIGPTAVIADIAVTYLTAPYHDRLVASLPEWVVERLVPLGASVLIAGVTLTHCFGHKESGRFQAAVTTVTALLLLALGAGGVLFGSGSWDHLHAGGWPTAAQWPALATGLIYVSYAYSGWNGAGYLAGEMRDPVRLLPRALIFGTLSVTVLYVLVNLAYVYALDPAELAGQSDDEVKKVAELAVVKLFGRRAADVFATLVGLSLVASVSAYILTGPRILFAMARDGLFPAVAGKLHAARSVPVPATLVLGACAVVFVWLGSLRELLDYVSVGLAATSALVVASVFRVRRRNVPGSYRLPLYPLPPLLYLAVIAGMVVEQLRVPDPKKQLTAALSLATIAAGIPLARLFTRKPTA
jgi:APA family basic amino acid/polyamine antiporter